MTDRLGSLAAHLDPERPLAIQTHDYPDIDAVASSWALASLLSELGIDARCAFGGEIRSRSLGSLIAELDIELHPIAEIPDAAQIVVVDGSPGNGNVSLIRGQLIGVIDHHLGSGPMGTVFTDVRAELAACSTMISGYWTEAGRVPPRPIATALLAGIQSDTDFLSRRCSDEDFAAYASLYREGDWQLASRVVRTSLDLRELGLVVAALQSSVVKEGLLFASIKGQCSQEALAVLAEFALRAEELSAAVVAEREVDGLRFSVRSRSPDVSAFTLAREAIGSLGSTGGHAHSAGGFVPARQDPGEDAIRERFFSAALRAARRVSE